MTTILLFAICYAAIEALVKSPLAPAVDAFAPKRLQTTPMRTIANAATSTALNLRVAYQGEPGAYSEKSTRELLGNNVVAIGKPNFEACFRAVAAMEVDYCCLPVENSLGGSIHENYDLMLRYDLTICAEHEFRVRHCVLAKHGVKLPNGKRNDEGRDDDGETVAKYAISHPQALAQCDNYLRSLGITPIPTYDTAGSAKMIQDDDLPDRCTPENTIAIASDLAGETYGMNCLAKGVEDDDSNFTRFLLLGRKGVLEYLGKDVPSKTSVVFTLPNTAGALYKALACFSLRDIDFSKIESRPTSAALLNYLKFRKTQQDYADQKNGDDNSSDDDLPRFRYCFYLDFLDAQLSINSENALSNLREFTDFVRILGSYPQKSQLVGPVKIAAEEAKIERLKDDTEFGSDVVDGNGDSTNDAVNGGPLNIGLVGFGSFGQVLATRMVEDNHRVSCLDVNDMSVEAEKLGVEFYFDTKEFFKNLDIVVLAIPLIRMQEVIDSIPINEFRGKLVVDVSPFNDRPKSIMLEAFANYPDIDVLVTNPMLGILPQETDEMNINRNNGATIMKPISTTSTSIWEDRPMIYERARVADVQRCNRYLEIFENARCEVIEDMANDHDATVTDAQFMTHLIGRLLDRDLLPPTPIMTKEYKELTKISEMAAAGSFDRFYGMYKYNELAGEHIKKLRENLASLECALAARGAYLSAKDEIQRGDRQKLLAETRMLLQELARSETNADDSTGTIQSASANPWISRSEIPGKEDGDEIVIL
eukprot:CAMPEP_0197180788 /NCGR_PEP_ID=MMETSP1423-20130617/5276_1 /TAXON_ID=476441 /ORGANISM="Pseudo-nitzschia heimii, Strain UNC1101" /LENGTH=762 /DNA_ID=CAMNT_0042630913 /DNA_START=201 /DNA_END=2489 /DNA_ORIENTATION=-